MYARLSPLTEKETMPSFLRSHIGSTRQETAVPVHGDRDKLSSSPVIKPNRCRDADCLDTCGGAERGREAAPLMGGPRLKFWVVSAGPLEQLPTHF